MIAHPPMDPCWPGPPTLLLQQHCPLADHATQIQKPALLVLPALCVFETEVLDMNMKLRTAN